MSNSRILPEFELLAPTSIAEAVEMASEYKDGAAVLAGGTDLMIMLQKSLRPQHVIALGEIPDLDYITYSKNDGLRIGALVTAWQLVQDSKVKKNYTALWQAASSLGSPQIRNAATIVGNILRASPSGDCCCAMLACDLIHLATAFRMKDPRTGHDHRRAFPAAIGIEMWLWPARGLRVEAAHDTQTE